MKSATLEAIFSTIAGIVAIVQVAVLANAHLTGDWVWIVPTAFAVAVYVLGRITGTTTTNATANVQTNQLATDLRTALTQLTPAVGTGPAASPASVAPTVEAIAAKLEGVGQGKGQPPAV